MLTKVNDVDLRTLGLFTKGYDKSYYIREVQKELEVSSRTALNTLAKLETQGILSSTVRGKIKLYTLKSSLIAREFMILAEQYKKISFLNKNLLIKEIVENISSQMNGIVILFGSYAKNLQKDDSDLDLFIVGEYDSKLIKRVGKTFGMQINVKSYPLDIFCEKIHEDILLTEINNNHILLFGVEDYVAKVRKWIK